jgi:hypothetical protein
MAGNIVVQMDKIRYKDGKGDPKGFISFLNDNHLPRGILPRYRGNRLHILFHICGKFVQHLELFKDFLSSGSRPGNTLKASIYKDFTNITAVRQIFVLALLGKLLSGPWMTKFYTAPDEQIDYLAGIAVVQMVLADMKNTLQNPVSILSRSTDFLGNQLRDDDLFRIISTECPQGGDTLSMIKACLEAVIGVLERQYNKYFNIDVNEQLEEETKSARCHNMDSEEMMGMFSSIQKHSPNASLCYMSAKIRAKKNKTCDYLDDMDAVKQESVVLWALSEGRVNKQRNRMNHIAMRQEISRREHIKRQKKDQKERKKIEELVRTLEVNDIDKFYPGLNEKAKSDLADILHDEVVGRNICHVWYDSDTRKRKMENGRIERKKKNSSTYVVAYWEEEGTYEDAVDYVMSKYQLAADVVSGDLYLA